MPINKLIIQYSNNNVGIGTITPAGRLHVDGGDAYFGNELNTVQNFYFRRNGSSVGSIGTYNSQLEFSGGSTAGQGHLVVAANGNIGVGVTSPRVPLDLGSTNNRGQIILLGETGANNRTGFGLDSGTAGMRIFTVNDNAQMIDFGGISTTNGTTWTRNHSFGIAGKSSWLNEQGGNVGVGTTSPGTKLDVNGTITSNASGTGTFHLGYATGSSRVAARITGVESPSYSATGKIGFSVTTWGAGSDYGLTEVMAIDMRGADSKDPTIWMNPFGGNVGIGTTSPSYRLDVYSNTTNTGAQIRVKNEYAAGGGSANATINIDGYGGSELKFWRNGVQEWKLERVQNTDDLQLNAYGGAVSGNAGVGVVQFWDYDTGRVGIGTTSPASKVHISLAGSGVSAPYANGLIIESSSRAALNFFSANTGDGYIFFADPQSSVIGYMGYEHTDDSLRFNTANTVVWMVGSSTKMQLLSNGNVGIGTTSPSGKLHIAGGSSSTGVQLYVSTDAGYTAPVAGNAAHPGGAKIVLWDNQSGVSPQKASIGMDGNADIWFNNAGAQAGAGFTFYTGDGASASPTARLKITKDGNIGIGTTSPAGMLDVSSSATLNNTYFRVTSNTASSYIQHYFYANTAFMRIGVTAPAYSGWAGDSWIYASRGLVLSANDGTGYTYYAANGNVGVATMSPNEKFHVAGNIHAYAAGGIDAGLYASNSAGSTVVAIRSNGNTHFNGGNVGIGTTSPAQKLDVVGTIRTAADANTGTIIFGSNDSDVKIFRDNSYDFVIQQNASSSNPLYLAGAGDVRVSIDSNNNGTGNKFVVGNDAVKSSNDLFYVNESGNAWLSGTLTEASSVALKKNINPIENALDFISRLAGVTYDRKDGTADNRAGLIAEEVEQVLPNLVMKDKEGNPSGIQYTNLIAYLVESIKELKAEIDVLKSK